jgi:amphi-Trp domain-containing protein
MKQEIEVEGTIELKKAVEYLEQILRSLKDGTVFVQCGDKQLALTPAPVVQFQFEAKQKKDKQEISFELTWKDGMHAAGDFDLSLSSHEPEKAGQGQGKVVTVQRDPVLFRKFEL